MSFLGSGWRPWATVAVAVLGALAGNLAVRRSASACSCVEDTWSVRLVSVESDAPEVSHQAYWFEEGELSSYTGHAHIWSLTLPPEQVHRVAAGAW